jgi:N-acetylglutamate synthase-like GNAT family acetyltransferase
MPVMNIKQGDCLISTDRDKLDLNMVHRYLTTESYWSPGIPFDTVKQASEHSLCFGVYHKDKQIGYARIISDYTTIAYLADVFILSEFRGNGLSKWLIKTIQSHPDLQGLRRWILLTKDAHGLYRQTGWKDIAQPELWMEIHQKDIYKPKQT